MAYLTCPDCVMPNTVGDDAVKFRCMSCCAEIVFETCADCGYKQSIPSRWHTAFTCGKCNAKCDIPRFQLIVLIRVVNNQDFNYVQSNKGGVTAANFRKDINADGTINKTDANLVKSRKGHSLP